MKQLRITRQLILAAAAIVMAGQVVFAGSLSAGDRAPRRLPAVEAIAALQPVGAASGWGRVEIEDSRTSSGATREAEIRLFDLEPATEYTVEVDNVILAKVFTNNFGDAHGRLGGLTDSRPSIPSGVGAALQLRSATVRDPSMAFVLEGGFVVLINSSDDGTTIHEERITLDDISGGAATGMAKVERDDAGKQEFETRAGGLDPGDVFEVRVDGILAGVVTVDAVGQAELDLEAPDDENPLPEDLQPIESLRLVEWIDQGGQTVLSGSFSGQSNGGDDDGDESLEGFITGFTDDGFLMNSGNQDIQVIVTLDTIFEDFSSLADLMIGDPVEVEGDRNGDTVTAWRVELRNGDDDDGDDDGDGEESLEGAITSFTGDGFRMDSGGQDIQVIVTADTIYEDFSDLSELSVGDLVEVEGELTGTTITATRVELKSGDDGGNDGDDDGDGEESLEGAITSFTGDGFRIDAGGQDIQVIVTADTVFEDFTDLSELSVGDLVEVEGELAGTTIVATRVELKSGDDSP